MADIPVSQVAAIDVHGHYGRYPTRSDETKLFEQFMTGDANEVARRGRQARTQWTVVSPLSALIPRGEADVVAGNEEAFRIVPQTPGLLQWVVLDPLMPDTFNQARDMLQAPHCVGIKIHPEEHIYPIKRHGGRIFEFAGKHNAVVLAHSGDVLSVPTDYVPFADAVPQMRLIVAHIGHGPGGDPTYQVRAITQAKHRNIWADTSSAKSMFSGLIEWAVGEAGHDRVLYGTDTPLYDASAQRARIDDADLSDAQKRRVLRDNAVTLLKLDRLATAAAVAATV